MKKPHLIVNLDAPLMAFGGEAIDNYGVIRRFPSASMLTGLFANALGWRRVDRDLHQRLQDRLVFAVRIEREPRGGLRMTDYQTVRLYEDERGWTTRGKPDGREKSPSYKRELSSGRRALTWQRYRDYFADMRVCVALRLEPVGESPSLDDPSLDDLAKVLDEPARPLFIGRKPCLPSAPLFGGFSDGDTALAALMATPFEIPIGSESEREREDSERIHLFWPQGEGADGVVCNREYMITDQRNWVSGLHGGGRWAREGSAARGDFGKPRPERNE